MHLRAPVLGSAVALIVSATVGGTVGAVGVAGAAQATPGRAGSSYQVHKQFADQAGKAAHVDHSLVNAWGLAQPPGGPLWVADNGTNVATLYTANSKVPLTVSIPGGAPTGQIFNSTSGFKVPTSQGMKPALFILDSETGVISGWSGSSGTMAAQVAKIKDAVFKGLAFSNTGGPARIYATDFHHGVVDVWNSSWQQVRGGFRDPHLPAGFAPFGIQAVGNDILVSYAKQDAARHDDVAGVGNGYVDLYNRNGMLLDRVISKGPLNSPWGLDIAPMNFGAFSGALLVGNFGDGLIHAYSTMTGAFMGTLKNAQGNPVILDGLWGLLNGNGVSAAKNAVIFSAGPQGESHGLLGFLTAN